MIIIFSGLPRNVEKNLDSILNFVNKLNAQVIFSTNNDINNCKLPHRFKVIINENNEWYQYKMKEISKYPRSEYINMLQWLRFSVRFSKCYYRRLPGGSENNSLLLDCPDYRRVCFSFASGFKDIWFLRTHFEQ